MGEHKLKVGDAVWVWKVKWVELGDRPIYQRRPVYEAKVTKVTKTGQITTDDGLRWAKDGGAYGDNQCSHLSRPSDEDASLEDFIARQERLLDVKRFARRLQETDLTDTEATLLRPHIKVMKKVMDGFDLIREVNP